MDVALMCVGKSWHLRVALGVGAQDMVQGAYVAVAQVLGRLYVIAYRTQVGAELRDGDRDSNLHRCAPIKSEYCKPTASRGFACSRGNSAAHTGLKVRIGFSEVTEVSRIGSWRLSKLTAEHAEAAKL